jgi:L-alanine-DL-glutamate epimerase-like enolase superfamily enzyme
VLGADPTDLADVHARMERTIRPSFSVGQPLAKAAIDLACHDLWGKRARKSVAQLLGGVRQPSIQLSWTVQSSTLDGACALMEQGKALGYSSFNVKVGYPQTPDYDVALVRAVREFAPNGFHWCDANTSYELDDALRMAPKFADAGFQAWESPLPPHRIRGYQALTKQGALPILMDEGIVAPAETEEFMALGMMNGIAMKVARCGGLWPAMRITKLLEDHGLAFFASGLTDPDWSLAASIHLFAAGGLTRPAALNGPQYIVDKGTTEPNLRAEGDVIRVPITPGLGVTPNARAIAALRPIASV